MTRADRLALLALLALLAAWLGALALSVELAPDEAYYRTWAQGLRLSYLDHPPLVAWLIAASQRLLGDSALAVRLPALACALGTLACVGWMGHTVAPLRGARPRVPDKFSVIKHLSASPVVLAALGAAVTPALGLGGALMTPDAPLVLAWTAAAAGLVALAEGAAPRRVRAAAWIGLWLAAGLLAKASMALLLPLSLALALVAPSLRPALPGLGAGALLVAPLYAIGLARGDIFAWQLGRLDAWALRPLGAAEALGGFVAAAGLGPGLLMVAFAAAGLFVQRRWPPALRALWLLGAAPLLLWALLGAFIRVEVNWALLSAPTLWVGALRWLIEARPRALRAAIGLAAALTACGGAMVLGAPALDPWGLSAQVRGWDAWAHRVADAAGPCPGPRVFITDRYQEAAALNAALHEPAWPDEALRRSPHGAAWVAPAPHRRPTAFQVDPRLDRAACIVFIGDGVRPGPRAQAAALGARTSVEAHPSRGGRLDLQVWRGSSP